jgi:hypothetical protein
VPHVTVMTSAMIAAITLQPGPDRQGLAVRLGHAGLIWPVFDVVVGTMRGTRHLEPDNGWVPMVAITTVARHTRDDRL